MAFIGISTQKLISLLEVLVSEGLPEFCFMQLWVLKPSPLSWNIPPNHQTLLYNPHCSVREVSVVPGPFTPDLNRKVLLIVEFACLLRPIGNQGDGTIQSVSSGAQV